MRHLILLLLLTGLTTPELPAQSTNQPDGPATPRGPAVVLPDDGSWLLFSWNTAVSPDATPEFTFSGPGTVDVSDAFIDGDRFRVYDNGVLLGETSPPTDLGQNLSDCDDAFADPGWSSGTFVVGPGPHQIRIEVSQAATGFATGAGCIRRTAPPLIAIPTVSPLGALLLAILIGCVGMLILAVRRHRSQSPFQR